MPLRDTIAHEKSGAAAEAGVFFDTSQGRQGCAGLLGWCVLTGNAGSVTSRWALWGNGS